MNTDTKKQYKPDSGRGSGIARDSLGSAGDRFTLTNPAQPSSDTQSQHAAEKFYFSGTHAARSNPESGRTSAQAARMNTVIKNNIVFFCIFTFLFEYKVAPRRWFQSDPGGTAAHTRRAMMPYR